MTAAGSWDDILDETEAKLFVGREQELAVFRQQISLGKPDYLIFYITGQGGVGKSTLLNRYRDIAKDAGFLLADCDEQQKSIVAVLGRFSHQLAEQTFPLKRFEDRYRIYRQRMSEIENDPEAPQGLATLMGRTMMRAAFIGGDLIPGVRKGLEYLPKDSLETQAGEWTSYLFKKLSNNKDDIALVREPVAILTSLFFEDLNEIAKVHPVILCFENFEETRQDLQEWILRLREYKPSQSIRLAIAGRDLPGAGWEPLYRVTLNIRLDRFTEQEAETFLDVYGVTDAKRRREIIDFSGRLPVLMSWLAVLDGSEPDSTIPTHDIVERFLRWIKEPSLRQIALLVAFPRIFNADILMVLLGNNQDKDAQSALAWLQTMPFVRQRSDGWQYHNVVRRMMLRYQRQESPQSYRQVHTKLADFYCESCLKLGLLNDERWLNEQWRKNTLAYVYHFLMADPIKHWPEVISLFTVAIHKRRSFARELMDLLCAEDVHDELSQPQNDMVQLFRGNLQAIGDGNLEDGLSMFNQLCIIPDLTPQAKGYAFAYRGICALEGELYEKAIGDFGNALQYVSEEMWIIVRRGISYRNTGDLQKAVEDFDRAITLEKENGWLLINRGVTYQGMGNYEKALEDYEKVITADEKDGHALMHRGETYQEMGQSEKALADFDRAIELNENYSWAFAHRGNTYQEMGQSEKALADFDRAIELNENYSWAFARRGELYWYVDQYEKALRDFDRAIELGNKLPIIFARRGDSYREMGQYEKALADFDEAITLDDNLAWAFAHRGETYREMGQSEKALADFDQAIVRDEKTCAFSHRGETYRVMGEYEKAIADFDQAIVLNKKTVWIYNNRGEVYQAMREYEKAIADFDQAIALDEKTGRFYDNRGEAYRAMGEYEKAIADFDQAIALGVDSYNSRGLTLSYLGRYSEALNDYEHGLKEDPNSISSLYNIAVVMSRWKGFPVAQTYIDRARKVMLSMLDTNVRGSAIYGLGGLVSIATKNSPKVLR